MPRKKYLSRYQEYVSLSTLYTSTCAVLKSRKSTTVQHQTTNHTDTEKSQGKETETEDGHVDGTESTPVTQVNHERALVISPRGQADHATA